MKHTKANVVKVLEAVAVNKMELSEMFDGDLHDRYMTEATSLFKAVELLTDKTLFDAFVKIYKLDEGSENND